MSTAQAIRHEISSRGLSVLGCVADIMEAVNKKNLAVARDVTTFAVNQVRMPTKAKDFGDYRKRNRDAFRKLGNKLQGYGNDYFGICREVPGQLGVALRPNADETTEVNEDAAA